MILHVRSSQPLSLAFGQGVVVTAPLCQQGAGWGCLCHDPVQQFTAMRRNQAFNRLVSRPVDIAAAVKLKLVGMPCCNCSRLARREHSLFCMSSSAWRTPHTCQFL